MAHRLLQHGCRVVVISTVTGTFYEWLRTLEFSDEHLDPEIWSGDGPEGISL